jgi:hypothetical protein
MRTLSLNRWKSSEGWSSLQASANGANSSASSLARCSAPQLGKLHHTSPKPNAPSLSSIRTNTAGRLRMTPNEVSTGVSTGAWHTQISARVSLTGPVAASGAGW